MRKSMLPRCLIRIGILPISSSCFMISPKKSRSNPAQNLRRMKKLVSEKSAKLKDIQQQLVHAGRLASLGEMATGLAHELNQPLALIRAQAELFKLDAQEEKCESSDIVVGSTSIIDGVDRAALLIEHMRGFARAETDQNEHIDLSKSVRSSLVFFKQQFRTHQIELVTDLDENLPPVQVHPQRFEQVVVNFLTNARYAVNQKTGEKNKSYRKKIIIRMKLHPDTHAILFEVEDNGIGMDKKTLKRCSEPFFTTKSSDEGTGLGLSIVRGILEEFNGTLEIKSILGQGTIMRVDIPVALDKPTR